MRSTSGVISRMPVRRFAEEQASRRLGRLVFQVQGLLRRSLGSPETVEGIHHLRVAGRRFRALLDTFEDLFPPAEVAKVKKSLRQVFKLAGEVRNRDIAIHLLEDSQLPSAPSIRESLWEERRRFERLLNDALRAWVRKDFSARWRAGLNLP